jgi:hypothetical protein
VKTQYQPNPKCERRSRKYAKAQSGAKKNKMQFFAELGGFAPLRESLFLSP